MHSAYFEFSQGQQITRSRYVNKIYKKKYHTVGTFQNSNRKIIERGKIDTTKHTKYMTAHFPGLVKAFQ